MRHAVATLALFVAGCTASVPPPAAKAPPPSPMIATAEQSVPEAPKADPKPAPPPEDRRPAFQISANELWHDYGRNAVAADAKYLGKYVEVAGHVLKVESDDDGYYVGLRLVSGEGWAPGVVARVDKADAGGFVDYVPGQAIRLTGKVVGKRQSFAAYKDYYVELASARPIR